MRMQAGLKLYNKNLNNLQAFPFQCLCHKCTFNSVNLSSIGFNRNWFGFQKSQCIISA